MTFWNLSPTKFFFWVTHTMRVQVSYPSKNQEENTNDNEKNSDLHSIFLLMLLLCDGKRNRGKKLSF